MGLLELQGTQNIKNEKSLLTEGIESGTFNLRSYPTHHVIKCQYKLRNDLHFVTKDDFVCSLEFCSAWMAVGPLSLKGG